MSITKAEYSTKVELYTSSKGIVQIIVSIKADGDEDAIDRAIAVYQDTEKKLRKANITLSQDNKY